MRLSRSAKVVLGVITALVLLFIYIPLMLVVVNSFNADRTFGWPPKGFTLEWWAKAFDSPGVREAVLQLRLTSGLRVPTLARKCAT